MKNLKLTSCTPEFKAEFLALVADLIAHGGRTKDEALKEAGELTRMAMELERYNP